MVRRVMSAQPVALTAEDIANMQAEQRLEIVAEQAELLSRIARSLERIADSLHNIARRPA